MTIQEHLAFTMLIVLAIATAVGTVLWPLGVERRIWEGNTKWELFLCWCGLMLGGAIGWLCTALLYFLVHWGKG